MSLPSQPTDPSSESSGRRRRKRVRSSTRQLKKRFSWEGPGGDDKYQRQHRWGLIVMGGLFLAFFLGMGFITYKYFGKFQPKEPPATKQIKQTPVPQFDP